jgi:hypothetical protein
MENTKDKVREFLTWLVRERDFEFSDPYYVPDKKFVVIFLKEGEYVVDGKVYKNNTPLPFQDGDVPWKIIWAK